MAEVTASSVAVASSVAAVSQTNGIASGLLDLQSSPLLDGVVADAGVLEKLALKADAGTLKYVTE